MQRQQEDNRYYTCIRYVKIVGTPVYGFLPSSSQPSRSSDLHSCESMSISSDHEHYDSVDQQLGRLPYLVPKLYTSSATEEESSDSAATMAAGSSSESGKGNHLQCCFDILCLMLRHLQQALAAESNVRGTKSCTTSCNGCITSDNINI